MGWGDMRPDATSIKERHKKKKRKEDKEKKRKEKLKDVSKEWKKARKSADYDRMKEVADEKARLKKIATFTKLKEKAKSLKSDAKIQSGDLDFVLAHIEAHPGISYIDMLSLWDEKLGIVAKIPDARLCQCLSWLQEQGLITHDSDDDSVSGHRGFYTTEHLLQLKQEKSGQNTCQQDVSKVSSDDGGA